MNIFERYKNYREERRLSRLEQDLAKINERFAYDPFKVSMPSSLADKTLTSKRLVENFAWHSASIKALTDVYKRSSFDLDDTRYFWTRASDKTRKIHSGIPNLISRKMSTILFGNGYDVGVTVYKDGQEEESKKDEKASKKANEILNLICEEIELKDKLKKGAIAESWSGHISAKFSVDTDLSPFPILEIYDKRSFEVVKKRGITQAIIYKSYYKKGSNDYIHHEIYTTGLNNISVIKNELYLRKGDGTLTNVPLTVLEETAELVPELAFKGLTGILALEKPNLEGIGEFVDSPYGVSDYAGAYSTYDGLDEIVSEIVGEIRTNKTIRYIPDVFLPVDSNGKFMEYDDFITNYSVTHDGTRANNQNHDPQINITEVTDKTAQHYEKFKIFVAQACNMSGLSPLSLGITGLESINSSDKSTRERAKTTLETRNDKIELWKPFLQKLLVKLMEITSWIQKHHPYTIPKGIPKIDIDYSNCDILVSFADYVEESKKERIENWGLAKQYGIASVDLAVRKVHGDDLTESDIIDEINRIKFEQGIMFNTPDSLLLTGTDGIDKFKQKEQEQE